MLAMRISHGHWDGTLGLAILAAAFAALMFLIVAELLYSIRARVELGERSLRATLPVGRGPTPLLRYAHDIPYDRIAAVETRCEVYGGAMAPVMLRGVQLLTKDGTAVPLGSVNEACVDPAFPWTEIADEIARRAGVGVLDQGVVRRSVPRKMLGLAASEAERAPRRGDAGRPQPAPSRGDAGPGRRAHRARGRRHRERPDGRRKRKRGHGGVVGASTETGIEEPVNRSRARRLS